MRYTSQVAVVAAVAAIGAALVPNNGEYDNIALVFLGLALLLVIAATLNVRVPAIERHGDRSIRWAMSVAIVIQAVLFSVQPIFSAAMPRWIVIAVAGLVGASALLAIFGRLAAGKAVTWLCIGSVAIFGAITLYTHPDFVVDVRLFQQVGSQALIEGVDPYIIRFPNIYSSPFYGPYNVGADGMLKGGFLYPPLVAILGIPGVLLGDVRISHVLAMAAAAVALGFARPGRLAIGALALFALIPRTLYLLAGAWSEPMSILLLCLTVWAAVRQMPKTTGALAGLLIVSKQYFVVITPLLWLLACDRRDRLRMGLTALLSAIVVNAPFAMWHPAQFFNSVVEFHVRQPFRADSLSFLAAFAHYTGREPSPVVGVIVIIAIGVISAALVARMPRTPSAFALSVALVVLLLFAFFKQAHMNYYAFAYAALCAALATSSAERADPVNPRHVTVVSEGATMQISPEISSLAE